MEMSKSENAFGIGAIKHGERDETAVVVADHVCPLSEIVRRHGSNGTATPDVMAVLADWDHWHDWLRGLDLKPTPGDGWIHIDEQQFRPCVPEPWNIFQTYHNYDRPSRTRGTTDPPKHERVLPDMFMGSRSALGSYGSTVFREYGGVQFDFEVEPTIVIGRPAFRVKAEKAYDYIAGYTIANDYTMHFGWWSELRKKSHAQDHIRRKNFPGYTPLSRTIVPKDLVGDPHDLAVKAWVDGVPRQDARTNAMLWTVPELVEYLSHVMPLRPGDLILTGAPEELPYPPGAKKGLRPGQTFDCQVEKIGRLVNTIGEQSERQPNGPA
jgi:2-keto-4-pentenoate hydratase/2-oxohepta-3-ene-1,7-dioic acid hydratase in catechol pathway